MRRREAARLLRAGMKQSDIARVLGVARQTVNIWAAKLAAKGSLGLLPGRRGRKVRRLTERQRSELMCVLRQPAVAGRPDLQWTVSSVAAEIERRYGVNYGRDRVVALLREAGLTLRRGRKARLTDREFSHLVRMLEHGPMAAGYKDGYWTVLRVKAEVQRWYGVCYERTRIVGLLHRAGFEARRGEGRWRPVSAKRLSRVGR